MIEAVTIFGKDYPIVEEKTDTIQFNENKVSIPFKKEPLEPQLEEFLSELLFSKLEEIHKEIEKEGKINLLGNLDFEITQKIDNKKHRIAKLKGNKIILKSTVITFPENILRYIFAHEIAHVENKRHTRKFWKTVELIYPNFKEAKKQLAALGTYF
ncbi:MAG: M48 family metallopeptidase [Asgard group archaeon]|nr:M48 family metallopeptidase [Asgard group archaeon]